MRGAILSARPALPVLFLLLAFGQPSFGFRNVTRPHLNGIFVALTPTTLSWTRSQWTTDLRSMADVGIEFLVVHHSAVGDNNVSAACPAGNYETYFDVAAACFRQAPASGAVGAGGSLGALLDGARAAGLRVHLGLAEQEKLGATIDGVRRNPLYGRYRNATAVQHFQRAQATLAKWLWTAFGGTGLIAGFYTFLEEPQNFASALPDWECLAATSSTPWRAEGVELLGCGGQLDSVSAARDGGAAAVR